MTLRFITVSATLLLTAAVAAAQTPSPVRITITDGRVQADAADVTAADVLARWATIGKFEIVGAEALPANRLTIAFRDEEELSALQLLVGPGFRVTVRAKSSVGVEGSRFEQVVVRPVSPETQPHPEQLHSSHYYVSEKNLGVEFRQNITPAVPTEDPVPERRYLYYTTDDQFPVQQIDAAPPPRPAGDPEKHFEYYSKPVPEMYRDLKHESLKVPVLPDPELRFKHYRKPVRIDGDDRKY